MMSSWLGERLGREASSKEEMFPCVGLNCPAMKWDNWTENLKYDHNKTRMTSLINKNIFWLVFPGGTWETGLQKFREWKKKGYVSITWLKFPTKSVTAVLEQYLSITAQPIQKQMCAENYKIFFRLMKFHFYAFFFSFFPNAAERDDGEFKLDGPNICTRIPQSM